MARLITILLIHCLLCSWLMAQSLQVSPNGRFLVTENGEPFFWLGDTAWELFHRCTKEEAVTYLKKRKSQGFNVIQAVALAELDGLHTPNAYGELPLIDANPATPNPRYFDQMEDIILVAAELNMYIALLPTWGDKLFKAGWGIGPEIFTVENAYHYGKWIGNRYRNQENIIWIIGGDRHPREGTEDVDIWRSMAEGVAEGFGGHQKTLMSFHPQPKENGGSSTWFHEDNWLDFNMHQTGHCPGNSYLNITHDYELPLVKPVLDGEPMYEDHPVCFNAKEKGYSLARDIRRIMYWNVFAGACGQTYGCHDIWQMYDLDKTSINGPLRPWHEALELPAANQVVHLKNLMLSRPYLTRIPDQSLIVTPQSDGTDYVIATRDENGAYAMVYFPTGKEVELDLSPLRGKKFRSWWYDVRTGTSWKGMTLNKKHRMMVNPPSQGAGQDWVLVVDSWDHKFHPPGQL